VGVISTPSGLRKLAKEPPLCDLVEIRADLLMNQGVTPDDMRDRLLEVSRPLLLTLRARCEGGAYPWASGERARVLNQLMPAAAVWDVEARHWASLLGARQQAEKAGVQCLISSHVFGRELDAKQLRVRAQSLLKQPAWAHKMAVHCDTLSGLNALIQVQGEFAGSTLALMGMGRMGKASREQLPWVGARLVYGYVDRAIVPGQSSSAILCQTLADLRIAFPSETRQR
jgi:3-dehydroquinate dehydratase type I